MPADIVCRTCGATFPLAEGTQTTVPASGTTGEPVRTPHGTHSVPPAGPQPATGTLAQARPPAYGGWPPYPQFPQYPGYPQYPHGPATPGGAHPSDGVASPNGQPAAAYAPPANQPAPGYPVYPQGYAAPYQQPVPGSYQPYQALPARPPYPAPQPYPANGAYGYPFAPAYGYATGYAPYYYPYAYTYAYARPPRAPGETLALVVSWIVTVVGGISVLCGIIAGLLLALAFALIGGNSLGLQAAVADFVLAPLIGGAFALYFGIRGILRKPSPRFSLPNPILFAGLAIVVWVVAIIVWHAAPTAGPAVATLPLLILSGALPAFAILAFASWRLHMPSSRRHVWMSLLYGATLAPLLAIILEFVALLVVMNIFGANASSAAANPSNINPNNPVAVFVLLLTISVAAPLVEEGLKPLGAVLIMRRLRTPASAFLMGLAAGIGFDIFETIGYIGSGEADWVNVSIERLGAGLLHGVGAGMAALGWYYLINGKGIRLRWLRGFGCIAYAIAQHAIFNGSNLIGLSPGPLGQWLSQPWYIGHLPFDRAAFLFFVYYAAIFGVLVFVTGRLVPGPRPRDIVPVAAATPVAGSGTGNGASATASTPPATPETASPRETQPAIGSGTR